MTVLNTATIVAARPRAKTVQVTDVGDQILAFLDGRAPGATLCPSEVARRLAVQGEAPEDWRSEMPRVHAAVDRLSSDGQVRLSWRGRTLAERSGPYRIGRPLED